MGHFYTCMTSNCLIFLSLQRHRNSDIRHHVVAYRVKNIQACSFVAVYCMNFIIFLCLLKIVFYVPLLAPNFGNATALVLRTDDASILRSKGHSTRIYRAVHVRNAGYNCLWLVHFNSTKSDYSGTFLLVSTQRFKTNFCICSIIFVGHNRNWKNMVSKISFFVRPKSPILSKVLSKFLIFVQI